LESQFDVYSHLAHFKRALKTEEVAELLSVSKKTIFKLVQSGTLSAWRVGGQLRYNPTAVALYLRSVS
jgi:excisionase family DNA binding protein